MITDPQTTDREGDGWVLARNQVRSVACKGPRAAVDAKLMERTGVDEFSLRRLRREFLWRCHRLRYAEAVALNEGGTCPRFAMMVQVLRDLWSTERYNAWLRYIEHGQRDIAEMCRGEYPISPYLIRLFSALFGIKVDFLLLGSQPSIDRVGVSIELGPMTGIR
jgi:hypothetical protein